MFFATRKRSKFVPATLRVDLMSRLHYVLAGAPASKQGKKQLTTQLMASASRRLLFETLEPRVLLSADLAPVIGTIHAPTDIDATLLAPPRLLINSDGQSDNPGSISRVVGYQSPARSEHTVTSLNNGVTDLVAASFSLNIEGAGSRVGSYQFRLPDPAMPPFGANGLPTNAPLEPDAIGQFNTPATGAPTNLSSPPAAGNQIWTTDFTAPLPAGPYSTSATSPPAYPGTATDMVSSPAATGIEPPSQSPPVIQPVSRQVAFADSALPEGAGWTVETYHFKLPDPAMPPVTANGLLAPPEP